jgi:hypothetical protein
MSSLSLRVTVYCRDSLCILIHVMYSMYVLYSMYYIYMYPGMYVLYVSVEIPADLYILYPAPGPDILYRLLYLATNVVLIVLQKTIMLCVFTGGSLCAI